MAATKYQVFEQKQGATADVVVWAEKGEPVEAPTGKAAIRTALADGSPASGRFFAVPIRNVTVADVTTKQEPTIAVTEASWTD